ncbi:MAG: hypothetical protein IJS65_07795 [Clostridia bacterium]|nr:hypothetical protein [Clostridia bacterium]
MDGKKTNRRDLLIAAAIVLAGAIISFLILSGVFTGAGKSTQKEETDTCYTVRFFGKEGDLLKEQTVKSGGYALPPEVNEPGYVFKGWSEQLFGISADTDAYAQFAPLDNDAENVVLGGAVYAEGKKPIIVPLRLDGGVGCSGFTIEAEYDPKLLKFKGAENTKEGVAVKNDEEEGRVTVNYSGEMIKEPSGITALTFSCRQSGCWKTTLKTATKEIFARRGDEEVYTDSVAYDTEIFIFG